MPGAAAQTASTTSSGSAVPVGLLGEVRKTTSGAVSRTWSAALPGSSRKPSARSPSRHVVLVDRAMIGCIE
jgi:hypothetical protein